MSEGSCGFGAAGAPSCGAFCMAASAAAPSTVSAFARGRKSRGIVWLPCVAAKPAISRATALQAHHTSGRASKQVSHPNQVALRRRCPTPQLAALQRRLQTGRGRAFKTRRPYITIITFTLQICHQRRITISSASEAALKHLGPGPHLRPTPAHGRRHPRQLAAQRQLHITTSLQRNEKLHNKGRHPPTRGNPQHSPCGCAAPLPAACSCCWRGCSAEPAPERRRSAAASFAVQAASCCSRSRR